MSSGDEEQERAYVRKHIVSAIMPANDIPAAASVNSKPEAFALSMLATYKDIGNLPAKVKKLVEARQELRKQLNNGIEEGEKKQIVDLMNEIENQLMGLPKTEMEAMSWSFDRLTKNHHDYSVSKQGLYRDQALKAIMASGGPVAVTTKKPGRLARLFGRGEETTMQQGIQTQDQAKS